jgi:Uncharacterized conserved protein
MAENYRLLDHTGDIGMEVWGPTRESLLQNAAHALTDILVDASTVGAREKLRFEIQADSPEALLVKFLQELLFQFDARGRIFSDFSVKFLGPNAVECLAEGETLERERHRFKTELKAVTYHHLRIWRSSDGMWWARVIFDV